MLAIPLDNKTLIVVVASALALATDDLCSASYRQPPWRADHPLWAAARDYRGLAAEGGGKALCSREECLPDWQAGCKEEREKARSASAIPASPTSASRTSRRQLWSIQRLMLVSPPVAASCSKSLPDPPYGQLAPFEPETSPSITLP